MKYINIDYDIFADTQIKAHYKKMPVIKERTKKNKSFGFISKMSSIPQQLYYRLQDNSVIVKLNFFQPNSLKRRIKYITREGSSEKNSSKATLYGNENFLNDIPKEKRYFSLIISPEKEGLRSSEIAKRLVIEIEQETGQQIIWSAADHTNTDNPHTHLIIRGKDRNGEDLFLPRELVKKGLREVAIRYSNALLGEKTPFEVFRSAYSQALSKNVTQVDRYINARAKNLPVFAGKIYYAPKSVVENNRLYALADMGYAITAKFGTKACFALDVDFLTKMTKVQQSQDILKTMSFNTEKEKVSPAKPGWRDVKAGRLQLDDHIKILSTRADQENHGSYRYIGRNLRTGEIYYFSDDNKYTNNDEITGEKWLRNKDSKEKAKPFIH